MKDPAPSRLAYRLNRLMLTPAFRSFLRWGLPSMTLILAALVWASDEGRRDALAGQIADLRRQIEERPEFMVRMMVVDGASADVEAEIREILPVDFPVSSFDIDLDTLRGAVEDLNPVARATVQIRGGGVLAVGVEERVPVAVWRQVDGLSLVDAGGNLVRPLAERTLRPDLPLIAGRGAADRVGEALAILDLADPVAGRIRALRRMGERRWDVVLDRGQVIMLPETGAETAMQKVMALDRAQDLLERDIVRVDFRNPRRPVLRLSDAAVEDRVETRTRPWEAVSE